MFQRRRGSVPDPLPRLILSDSVRQFFRSDKCCDEAVGDVLGPISGDLVLVDELDGVGAGVASRHALGKSANLVSVRVRPYRSSFWVGDELFIFNQLPSLPITAFAISQNHFIGNRRIDSCCGVAVKVILRVGGAAAKFSWPRSSERMYFGL